MIRNLSKESRTSREYLNLLGLNRHKDYSKPTLMLSHIPYYLECSQKYLDENFLIDSLSRKITLKTLVDLFRFLGVSIDNFKGSTHFLKESRSDLIYDIIFRSGLSLNCLCPILLDFFGILDEESELDNGDAYSFILEGVSSLSARSAIVNLYNLIVDEGTYCVSFETFSELVSTILSGSLDSGEREKTRELFINSRYWKLKAKDVFNKVITDILIKGASGLYAFKGVKYGLRWKSSTGSKELESRKSLEQALMDLTLKSYTLEQLEGNYDFRKINTIIRYILDSDNTCIYSGAMDELIPDSLCFSLLLGLIKVPEDIRESLRLGEEHCIYVKPLNLQSPVLEEDHREKFLCDKDKMHKIIYTNLAKIIRGQQELENLSPNFFSLQRLICYIIGGAVKFSSRFREYSKFAEIFSNIDKVKLLHDLAALFDFKVLLKSEIEDHYAEASVGSLMTEDTWKCFVLVKDMNSIGDVNIPANTLHLEFKFLAEERPYYIKITDDSLNVIN